MVQKLVLFTGIALLLVSFKGDGLIERVYPGLLGDYEFHKSVADRSVSYAKEGKDVFTVTINRKDQILFYRNGKKELKMHFVETTMPFLDDQNHVLFGAKNKYEPLFYRGDTIVIQSYPVEYQENYFIKKKK